MPSLKTLTDAQLKFYFGKAAERNEISEMSEIVVEMKSRGMRCTKYYDFFRWNKRSVREALGPFVALSQKVSDNGRTDYTPCGGSIFYKLDGQERNWIDAYTAIKRGKVNATFAVRVRLPGQDPVFALSEFGEEIAIEYKDLGQALKKWREIAERASMSQ